MRLRCPDLSIHLRPMPSGCVGSPPRMTRTRAAGWWLPLLGAVAVVFLAINASVAWGAAVSVCPTGETASVHNTGDAADDDAIWIHPTDTSLSTVIGTDKSAGGGLNVYDLTGKELYFNADGRLNNDDVRYNFPLGTSRVALVGASNRIARTLDFYEVNETDRSLTKVGAVPVSSAITTPRGFAFYHSPISGKYYAFVTDIGNTQQYELSGATGQVTGTLVRTLAKTPVLHTEGLVADDELGRIYLAEEDIGGIWRFGAEPTDPTTGTKLPDSTTTEVGGRITQDIKGLTMYYATGGRGYIIAVSQGGNSFHLFNRGDNAWVGEFKIVACNGIDAVTGIDGADVTNVNLGPLYPQGLFVTQDTANDTGNQNHKLVAWQSIANAFDPPLTIDTTFDPRSIGAPGGGGVDTTITTGPTGTTTDTTATLTFTSTSSAGGAPPSVDPNTPTPSRCALTLRGSGRADVIRGGARSERILGLGGGDRLFGNAGNDCLVGGGGGDLLSGGPGKDALQGDAGDDTLIGGAGIDTFAAGSGADTVRARDGVAETVHCGPGRDTAFVDRRDRVIGCEVVRRR